MHRYQRSGVSRVRGLKGQGSQGAGVSRVRGVRGLKGQGSQFRGLKRQRSQGSGVSRGLTQILRFSQIWLKLGQDLSLGSIWARDVILGTLVICRAGCLSFSGRKKSVHRRGNGLEWEKFKFPNLSQTCLGTCSYMTWSCMQSFLPVVRVSMFLMRDLGHTSE